MKHSMFRLHRLLLSTVCVGLPVAVFAQDATLESRRAFASLDGKEIRCELPPLRNAEQIEAALESKPQDLDQLSAQVQKFFDPANSIGAQFRATIDAQRANDWAQLCRYRDANAQVMESGHRPKAVFIGDSITDNWIDANREYFTAEEYLGRGIGGQTSAQMVARFYTDVVMLKPRAVHIMAGTNDIAGNTGPVTEEEYLANIRAMIDMAKANGIAVVLASIPPMTRVLTRPEFDARTVVRRLNARLAQLALERGVTFVDYFSPTGNGGWFV